MCPLIIHGYFSIVNSIILPYLLLVESSDAEPQIWRSCIYGALTVTYTLIFLGTSNTHIVQAQLYVPKMVNEIHISILRNDKSSGSHTSQQGLSQRFS